MHHAKLVNADDVDAVTLCMHSSTLEKHNLIRRCLIADPVDFIVRIASDPLEAGRIKSARYLMRHGLFMNCAVTIIALVFWPRKTLQN